MVRSEVRLPASLHEIYADPGILKKRISNSVGSKLLKLTPGKSILLIIVLAIPVYQLFAFITETINQKTGRAQAIQAEVEKEVQLKIDNQLEDWRTDYLNKIISEQIDKDIDNAKAGKKTDPGSWLQPYNESKKHKLTRDELVVLYQEDIKQFRKESMVKHGAFMPAGECLISLIMGIAIISALLFPLWLFSKMRRKSGPYQRGGAGAHGGAQWAKRDEIITAPTHRWVIPVWCADDGTARPWRLSEAFGPYKKAGLAAWAPPEGDAVCSHYLMIGATGSGKGAGIFSHVMCSSSVPSIYQDVKAECPNIDHPKWQNAIRWGCAAEGGWPSMRWNPLQEAFDDTEPEDACLSVASLLLPDNEGEDAWVSQLARPILAELFLSRQWVTLGDFADAVRGKSLTDVLVMAQIPGGLQAIMGGRNVPEYLSAAFHSNLAVYRMGWGRNVTSAHDFSLDDMIDKGGYVLSAETQDVRRAPLRLFWAMLFRKLMRSARPRPLNVLLDEAKAAGKIPDVVNALVTLRNRQVSIWLSFQSEAAITSVYKKEEAEALVDSFGNRITLLHGISARDAKQLSENMRSWSKQRGGQVGLNIGQSPSISVMSGTDDITALPLISAEDIENRGRRPGERWAIISARETTTSGHPLIVQMVEGEQLTRIPYPDEVQATKRDGSLQEVLSGSNF